MTNFKFYTIGKLLLVALLILPATLPLFRGDFFRMHDFTHVARLVELHRGLTDGQIPPRWSDHFGFGYGMPLLHFYAPLAYYLAEGLYAIGVSAVWSIKAVFWLNFLLGFWFMYGLAKEFWGKWGGILSAVAFVYAPYRAAQFYVRGTLGEMLAMTFLPLAMWGLYKVCSILYFGYRDDKKSMLTPWIIVSSMGIAGVFLSHNVIALFSIPFLGFWTITWIAYFSRQTKYQILNTKYILRITYYLLLTSILTLGLTVWFISPALLEKAYTVVDSIAGGYSYYKLHFIYLRQLLDPTFEYGGSILGPEDDISFQLGLAQWSLLVFSILYLVFSMGLVLTRKYPHWFRMLRYQILNTKSPIPLASFQITALWLSFPLFAISIFLMTFHAEPIWDAIPFIHIAQFPWRLLTLTATVMAFMVGVIGYGWEQWQSQMTKYFILPRLGMIGCVLALIGFNVGFFHPEKYAPVDDYYYTDVSRIHTNMSGILKDYLPIWVKKEPKPGMETVLAGADTKISNIDNSRTGYLAFNAQAAETTSVKLRRFYFPGWQVWVDGQPATVTISKPYGFMMVTVPPGEHFIEARLQKTSIQLWSDLVSLVSWVGLVGYGCWYFFKKSSLSYVLR